MGRPSFEEPALGATAASHGTPGSTKRRLVLGTGTGGLNQAITLLAWFALTPFILSSLGESGYGLWALAGSIASYGYLLDLGLGNAVVKYVAEHWTRADQQAASTSLSTALAIFSGLAVVTLILGAGLSGVFPHFVRLTAEQRPIVHWLVLLVAFSVAAALVTAPISLVLRALQRHGIFSLISTVSNLVLVGSSALVLAAGGGVLGLVAVNIPITLAAAVVHYVVYRRFAPGLVVSLRLVSRSEARRLFSFSTWMLAQMVSNRLQQRTDELIIALFLPVAAVTPYALARRLGQFAYTFAHQLSSVLLPMASELDARDDPARLKALLIDGTRTVLAGFMALGLVLVLLAQPILGVWVGNEYRGVDALVLVLTLAGLLAISAWPAGALLAGMARHRFVGLVSLGTGAANVLLSVVLVQSIGVMGVAIGTLIPTAVESVFFILPYAMRQVGARPIEGFREIVVPVLLPAVPTAVLLFGARYLLQPESILSLGVIALAAGFVYVWCYLRQSRAHREREAAQWMVRAIWRAAVRHLP